ncbi:Photosystem I biogenesis protein BtpA [Geodia barretti]|uniref:Photosystem I biogenesis protein BtpA n=1 Tax=Geodia barretti TaxID=519541 RepID=A0AA35W482_GEOBA|nr:Photosystem I biogenesis protein BtpA [Geodia barretti]
MQSLFGEGKSFIGVIHLPPLPGSPRWGGDLSRVLEQAGREAAILTEGGANGIIVENFGDAPFRIGRVEPETVAAMTRAVDLVCRTTPLPVGVNMLRSDAISALAVAVAGGAQFIRVNVHYGTMAADEGLVTGEAFETLRRRRLMEAEDVSILADVLVKHAVPLGEPELGLIARETAYRGLADGLIVTGPVTGQPAVADDVATVRRAVPDRPLLVGSGVNASNAAQFLAHANGAIVGTSLKEGGVITNPIDLERVRATAAAFGEAG